MPWKQNDPDPLEARRRQLEQQQRRLVEERRRLTEELHSSGDAGETKPPAHPVWRDEDSPLERPTDPTPARKKNLARQRRRDMVLFFLCIGLFLIVLVIVVWVAYVHNTSSVNGA